MDASHSQPTLSAHNVCYDPLDVDSFINYDQLRCASPSLSSSSSRSQSTIRPSPATANPNNTLLPPAQSSSAFENTHQVFSGPSHQYDLHKQQTPLPPGAVANTLAVNEQNAATTRYQPSFDAAAPDDSFFGMSPGEDLLDFSSTSDPTPSFGGAPEMDLEFDSAESEPLPAFFFPERSMSTSAEYVNPSALEAPEEQSLPQEVGATAPPPAGSAGRLWPGMHQQQAALAKARQQKGQQRPAPPQPRSNGPQPKNRPTGTAPSHEPTDAMVEEKISRLLQTMRQSNGAADEEMHGSNANGMPAHVARMRKEEDDMDEDERLLASEEGKKLSSKERRQLRNKVSARAFRSRRKEYIGQLEAELATKSNEANDLRAQNEALMHENTRLSDLSRMLLSSPAFSGLLESMSAKSGPPTTVPESSSASQAPRHSSTVPRTIRKDANPHATNSQPSQTSEEDGPRIGMTLLPDNTTDLSMLNLNGNGGWATGSVGADMWGAQHPQVFSVREVADGPAVDHIDTDALSGKSSQSPDPYFCSDSSKDDLPALERPLALDEQATEQRHTPEVASDPAEYDESDPAFALFADSPSPPECDSEKCHVSESLTELFHGLQSEKSFSRYELVDEAEREGERDVTPIAVERLSRLCISSEAALQRLERSTSHL
ncbi:MAG: hypothetical protein M1837_004474 [Sclerophora amabilis]|nr:MAG: hypothetical protein M1837_004474 [Sclerophora amabilis]